MGLPVLFMSGLPDGIGAPRQAPGTDFLAKPFSPEALARAAARLLAGRRVSPAASA